MRSNAEMRSTADEQAASEASRLDQRL